MPWQRVGEKKYFYRHERAGGKCRRVYVGAAGSPAAELAAPAADLRRPGKEIEARERQAEQARLREAEGPLLELCEGSDLLARASLVAAGFHRHDRCQGAPRWSCRRAAPRPNGATQSVQTAEVRHAEVGRCQGTLRPRWSWRRAAPRRCAALVMQKSGTALAS